MFSYDSYSTYFGWGYSTSRSRSDSNDHKSISHKCRWMAQEVLLLFSKREGVLCLYKAWTRLYHWWKSVALRQPSGNHLQTLATLRTPFRKGECRELCDVKHFQGRVKAAPSGWSPQRRRKKCSAWSAVWLCWLPLCLQFLQAAHHSEFQ